MARGHYRSIKQHTPEGHWDTLIVGSGIAGMACGAALSKHGHRVLLLEQHYVPGGMTHSFSRKGFRWDVGVHCLGEQNKGDVPGKLLHWLTDGRLEMNRLPELYERFWFPDGYQATYCSDVGRFQEQLIKEFPAEAKGLRKYFKLVSTVFNVARPFYALKATPIAVNRFFSAAIGWTWRRYWGRTTREVMDELFTDEHLKAILVSQWGYYGSPPSRSSFGMHAMVCRHFFDGAFYPVGGAESFARCLLETISEGGGQTFVAASVSKILIEHGRAIGVELANGQKLHADRVVSAVGAKNTIHRLLPEAQRQTDWAKSLDSITSSPAYFCLNLGFEGDLRAAGASETNNWLMESWDVDQAFWDLSDPDAVPPITYLSFPSMKDPQLEAGNRHTGEVLAFVKWGRFEQWSDTRRGRRPAEYEALKQQVAQRLIRHLERKLPRIMKHLVFHELATPLSTHHFTRSWEGGIYGYETTPDRFGNPYLTAHSPIRGLFLTGGDVVAPGVAGALVSGVITAAAIKPRVFLKLL